MSSNGQEIMRRLNFGREDVAHNRKGKLSPNQIENLKKSGRNATYVLGGIALVLMPIMWLAARSVGEFAILEGVVLAFCGLVALVSLRIMGKDAEAGTVEMIVGHPSMSKKIRGGKLRTIFMIGEREFSDLWLHKFLNEQAQYRVYFASKSGKIVALEPHRSN